MVKLVTAGARNRDRTERSVDGILPLLVVVLSVLTAGCSTRPTNGAAATAEITPSTPPLARPGASYIPDPLEPGSIEPALIGDPEVVAAHRFVGDPVITRAGSRDSTTIAAPSSYQAFLAGPESDGVPEIIVYVDETRPFRPGDPADGDLGNGRLYTLANAPGDFKAPFEHLNSVAVATPETGADIDDDTAVEDERLGVVLLTLTLDPDDLIEVAKTITVDRFHRTVADTGRFRVLDVVETDPNATAFVTTYEAAGGQSVSIIVSDRPVEPVESAFWLGWRETKNGITIYTQREPGFPQPTRFCTEHGTGSMCISSDLIRLSVGEAAEIFESLRPLKSSEQDLIVATTAPTATTDP